MAQDPRIAELEQEVIRLRAHAAKQAEHLSLALRVARAGIWEWDMHADTIVWSDEYFDLYGLKPGTTVPSHAAWLKSILPQDRLNAEAELARCIASRTPDFTVEYRIRHPRKGIRWLAGLGRFRFDEHGTPVHMIGLNIDVTDHKAANMALADSNAALAARIEAEIAAREAAQATLLQHQKMEALGRITGEVAHDFSNILTVVLNGTRMLRRLEGEAQNAAQRERLLTRILAAGERGVQLTRRLLVFARRQELRPVSVDLRHRLTEIAQMLAQTLPAEIAVESLCAEDVPAAMVDPDALELAMLNLALNARDAMPNGGRLLLTATHHPLDNAAASALHVQAGDYVAVHVRDTGHGMPNEVLAQAFEPFFTTKDVSRGTGLGLAQVYGFAVQSGGTAWLDSAPDRGTTVSMVLPTAP